MSACGERGGAPEPGGPPRRVLGGGWWLLSLVIPATFITGENPGWLPTAVRVSTPVPTYVDTPGLGGGARGLRKEAQTRPSGWQQMQGSMVPRVGGSGTRQALGAGLAAPLPYPFSTQPAPRPAGPGPVHQEAPRP